MHTIEPYYNWRHLYITSEDERSPLYGKQNSEVYFTDAIYDHLIHPQWDYVGCDTLFLKIIYTDYDQQYTIIEFIGEWNDALHNDIMFLKRNIFEHMMSEGIDKFILIGENILNFHGGDDSYYEEWFDDVEEGWIAALNFRDHVLEEIKETNIDNYLLVGGNLEDISWRTLLPDQLFTKIDKIALKRLGMA